MVIYHFCNNTFGVPFQAVAAEFARAHKIRIVRVLSAHAGPSGWQVLRRGRRLLGAIYRRSKRLLRGAGPEPDDLPTLYVSDVNSPKFWRKIRRGDAAVITGFNQIFSGETIGRFRSCINLHPSILPLYRGPVPTYWCIQNKERLSGFTFHQVTPQIDRGEPIYQQVVPIEDELAAVELERKIGCTAVPAFRRLLEYMAFGGEWTPQRVDAYQIYTTHQNYASFPP
ncbi:MAG: hypothetical protein M3Z37_04850 [Candidatus Eremiobacteraeota bacterium]|nr:hypothetical protein [Candidatus Eremiobacteraeota bacterium]